MNAIDLTNLPQEKIGQIMAILCENTKPSQKVEVKQSELKSIELDTNAQFEDFFTNNKRKIDGFDMSEKKRKMKLSSHDKVTYQMLNKIHECGSVENFMQKVREVVESKKDVTRSEVSSEFDLNEYV